MQRRSALKSLGMAFGGLANLPGWATGWTPDSIGHVATLSSDNEMLLGEIVETFIPETDTPGAKSLNVHQFAMRMIRDCGDESAQALLNQGLILTDDLAKQTYHKPFIDCDAAQRTDVLAKMSSSADAAAKQFANMIKNLTIQGYMNSEYVLVNVQKYTIAPGFYHGCVPLKT